MTNSLLGFSIDFLFIRMKEEDKRFNGLQLFKSQERIDVGYRKEIQVDDGKLYSIRIVSNLTNYSEVIDLVYDEINLQSVFLAELGLDEGISFDFFLEYCGDIEWTLGNQKLKKLNLLTHDFPGISLDSIDKSWNDENQVYNQEIFYQLIFSMEHPKSDKYLIEKKWNDEYLKKYKNHAYWNFETNEKKQSNELLLSLREDIKQFGWDEQYKDLLGFLSKYLNTLTKNGIIVTYGFYQQNRSDMSGGEIGFELVKEISKLGLDLRFSLNSKSPDVKNKY